MALVLGIDAAWSSKNPSGVALVATGPSRPRLIRAAPSYADFIEGIPCEDWGKRTNSQYSLIELLAEAKSVAGGPVNVIAVDMPVARKPVRARRRCDIAISKAFGGMGCSTHSPTAERPGKISDAFYYDALSDGFSLRTSRMDIDGCALLEVYPHVALLALCSSRYRLPYKLARRRVYSPNRTPEEGRQSIRLEWNRILARLSSEIVIDLQIADSIKGLRAWKAWEDVIDAIVCSWVGLEWLAGRAEPYGDADAAIWVPMANGGGDDVA